MAIKLPFVWPFGRCCRDCVSARRRNTSADWWPCWCWMPCRCYCRYRIWPSIPLERSKADHLDVISVRVRSRGYCKPRQQVSILEFQCHSRFDELFFSSACASIGRKVEKNYLVNRETFNTLVVAMAAQQQFNQIVDGGPFGDE